MLNVYIGFRNTCALCLCKNLLGVLYVGEFLVICLARLGVIFLLCKSDIAPGGRSDILFAFAVSNARSAYHCQRQYHARSAYHSPQANRVGAPALSQVRHEGLFCVFYVVFVCVACYIFIFSVALIKNDAAAPTAIPAIVPERKSQGNSMAIAAVSIIRHAVIT